MKKHSQRLKPTDKQIEEQFEVFYAERFKEQSQKLKFFDDKHKQILENKAILSQHKNLLIQQLATSKKELQEKVKIQTKKDFDEFKKEVLQEIESQIEEMKITQIQKMKAQQQSSFQLVGDGDQTSVDDATRAWMKKPLTTWEIKCTKTKNQPMTADIDSRTSFKIAQIIDADGKQFSGEVKMIVATCDSMNEPKKLLSLPPLEMFNWNNQDAPLVQSQLVSFSMISHLMQDSNGKLLFSKKPIQVVQKIKSDIKPSVLQDYKVWKYDILAQNWLQTGEIKVSEDGKEIKYDVQPRSKEEILRIMSKIGEKLPKDEPKFSFKFDTINNLIAPIKQLVEISEVEKYLLLKQVWQNLSMSQLNSYQKRMQMISQKYHKSSLKCLLLDKIVQYYSQKPTISKNQQDQVFDEISFIPSKLRSIENSSTYQCFKKLNRKSFSFDSQQIYIKSSSYSEYLNPAQLSQIQFEQRDSQSQLIKQIYLESPEGNFKQKFILINPKIKLFTKIQILEKVNTMINIQKIIEDINSETLQELMKKLIYWSEKKKFSKSCQNVKLEQSKGQEIIMQDSRTIAELILESKLNKFKLISTDKFLLRLQLAVLFQLNNLQLISLQNQLREPGQGQMQKQLYEIQSKLSKLRNPQYYIKSNSQFSFFSQSFKVFADQNEETIEKIFEHKIKNHLQVPQKKLILGQISNPEAIKYIKQIEQIFDDSVKKGLYDAKKANEMKKQKIQNFKKQYFINEEWYKNQSLIQRIRSELFPKIDFSSARDPKQLVQLVKNYCKTRQIIRSQNDIDKLRMKFFEIYQLKKSQQSKGLPGGSGQNMRADHFVQDLISKGITPDVARASMPGITNIDCLTMLTPEQMDNFTRIAKEKMKQLRKQLESKVKDKISSVNSYMKTINSMLKTQMNSANAKAELQKQVEFLSKQLQVITANSSSIDSYVYINLKSNDQSSPLANNKSFLSTIESLNTTSSSFSSGDDDDQEDKDIEKIQQKVQKLFNDINKSNLPSDLKGAESWQEKIMNNHAELDILVSQLTEAADEFKNSISKSIKEREQIQKNNQQKNNTNKDLEKQKRKQSAMALFNKKLLGENPGSKSIEGSGN